MSSQDDFETQIQNLIFKQDPVKANSVSLEEITAGVSMFSDYHSATIKDPMAIADILNTVLFIVVMKKVPNSENRRIVDLTQQDVDVINQFMIALGYKAYISKKVYNRRTIEIHQDKDKRFIWYRNTVTGKVLPAE